MSTAVSGQAATEEDLQAMPKQRLIEMIAGHRAFICAQAQTLAEIVEERDAARLLNELCHY